MRFLALIGALFTLACAAGGETTAAATALTLRYANPNAPTDTLVIERDAAGRIRASESERQWLIIRDGATYLVFTPPGDGGQVVTRLDDYIAVGAELRANLIRAGAMTGEPDATPYRLEEQGEATIGQWRGRRYALSPEGSGPNLDAVLSSDPALADARALATRVMAELARRARAVLIYPDAYVRMSGELLGRGMPLAWNGLELQAIAADPVPAARFELPGPALDRAALRALLIR